MKIQKNAFPSIEQLQDQYLGQNRKNSVTSDMGIKSFQEILESTHVRRQGEVRFSKHAAGRLADRNIELTSGQLERLREGTQKAEEKGIKESLVLMDDLAFIVNIPSNTVGTSRTQNKMYLQTLTERSLFSRTLGRLRVPE